MDVVSVHETEISVAKDTSIEGVQLGKAKTEKMSPKLCLL